ncbi:MAG: type VI secretion system baseplate subunit TssF, partial [Rhodospirillales bacterium]|nr:type VI secretion system baseplate subunit TssF [Rhodospirillales bacterium]
RLDYGGDTSSDPHVERLIESFAFLSARLQRRMDSDFPEIPSALLSVLYPHLTAPVPSMAIADFQADPKQARALADYIVPAGTELLASAGNGLTCRFRTSMPVTLWPVEVEDATLLPPGACDTAADDPRVAAVLRIRLCCLGNRSFKDFSPGSLRFHINADPATASSLYELLFASVLGITVRPENPDAPATRLRADAIHPVGFAADEALLPHPPQAHQGYRLLSEYFLFPQKFLFFDVVQPRGLGGGKRADLLILLTRRPNLALPIDAGTFRMACTPVVNLFRKTSEPIRIDHTKLDYRLVPDSLWERATEVHSILKVSATSAFEDESGVIQPLFSFTHADHEHGRTAFWTARREPASRADLGGSDLFLSFVDLAFQPTRPATQVVFAHTLCTNRDIAQHIAPGSALEIERDVPVEHITCLTRPSPQQAALMPGPTLWRLVSQLSLNHLSLADGEDGLTALKEILRLHAGGRDTAERQIAGLVGLSAQRVVRHVGRDAWRGFCRGLEVTLAIDEDNLAGSSPYLLSAVLSRFLGLYAAVNSFTQLVVTSNRRDGVWSTWPAMSGERPIL